VSALGDIRAELVTALSATGLAVFTGMPRRFEAPALLILPPDTGPYVVGAETFNSARVSLDVWIIIRPHTNDQNTDLDEIETHIGSVLDHTAGYGISGIDVPVLGAFEGIGEFVYAVAHLTKDFSL
jgi:hypothetical protein